MVREGSEGGAMALFSRVPYLAYSCSPLVCFAALELMISIIQDRTRKKKRKEKRKGDDLLELAVNNICSISLS